MATGKPRSSGPKRTPKVAGRGAPRVTVSKSDVDPVSAAEPAIVEPEASGADKPAPTASGSTLSGVERKRRAAAAAQSAKAEQEVRDSEIEAGPAAHDTASTYRLAGLLGAIAAVIGAIAAVFAFHPGASVTDNVAFVDQSATTRLISEATQAACTPFAFDYRTIDKSYAKVRDALTGEAAQQFRDYEATNRKAAVDSKSGSDCQVESIGVSYLNGDDAVVLTQLLVSTTQDGLIASNASPHVQLTMKLIDDRWRIAKVGDF
ncbi:hypothetical protein [Gordonia sp. (in: high G+C Gram-positive bacteria)]|uniref:hypothetical protein n=1 Tax=Gordonia sp. (in: high G+C Gram-positive bacteria) TaxID=84139 RepID=UPI003C720603